MIGIVLFTRGTWVGFESFIGISLVNLQLLSWIVLEMTCGFGIGLLFFSLKLNLLSGRLKFIGLLLKKEGLMGFWPTKSSSYDVLGLHLDLKTFKGRWCLGFSLKCWGFVWDLFMLLFAFWSYLLSLYRLSSYCQLFSITLFRGFLWEFCWGVDQLKL